MFVLYELFFKKFTRNIGKVDSKKLEIKSVAIKICYAYNVQLKELRAT